MVKKLLIFLFLYLSVHTSGCSNLVNSVQSNLALKKGETYLHKRQYMKAEDYLRKAVHASPEHAKAWLALGNMYFNIDDYARAREAFEEALRIKSEESLALAGLWMVELEEAGYSEDVRTLIKQDIDDLLSSEDDRTERLMAAYWGLRLLHEYDLAFQVTSDIVASGADTEILSELASDTFEEILREKDPEKRLTMITDFHKVFPSSKVDYMINHLQLRIAAKDLMDKELLFQFGEEWIRNEPDNRRAHFSVGRWYIDEDIDLEKGIFYIKKALILMENPDPADKPEYYPDSEWQKDLQKSRGKYYATLGQAYYKLGKYDNAERAFSNSIKYLDFDSDLYYDYGLLLEENGDTESAINFYVHALKSGENTEAEERLQKIVTDEGPLHKYFAGKEGITTFTDVSEGAGLSAIKAGRVAWGDYNSDGYEDILFNGSMLLRNNKNGAFTDVTLEVGISAIPGANGGIWGDINNDGHLDFYTFASGAGTTDRFWKNNGDGTFSDISLTAIETPDSYRTEAAAWGDYDNDGFIDLYIANYEKPLMETVARARCLPDRLLNNRGDETFIDVSFHAGIVSPEKMCGRGVNWGDYDNDGDADIYVANYRLDPNFLWLNNGDGTFSNAAPETGTEGDEMVGYFGHSIGAEWGDFNNDGLLDLFVSNLAHPRYIGISNKSMLLENPGPLPSSFPFHNKGSRENREVPLFKNRFADSGIRFEETSADPSFTDYDNDGILDLYFTSTYTGSKSFLYKGNGDGTFTDVTWLAGVRVDNGWGNAFADYDNDGDMDLLVASSDGVRLFSNNGNDNHWLQVQVVGTKSNSSGIGARVTITKGGMGGLQIREVQGGKGSGNQHSLPVEFGLGNYSGRINLVVQFPSGKIVHMDQVETDRLIRVEEPQERIPGEPVPD